MLWICFFPVVRAEVLRALFHHTQREMYVRELARWSELALRTVQRELATLIEIGLVTSCDISGCSVFSNRLGCLGRPGIRHRFS